MKKLFIILSFGILTTSLKSQDIANSDSLVKYQYRITFTRVTSTQSSLVENMSDFFRTKIEYYENINQYIFITDKDVEQSEFSKNFSQEITLFKKIRIASKL